MSEFATTTIIKRARKAHKCEECGRSIPVGESYTRNAGCFEGEMYAYALCAECDTIWRTLNKHSERFQMDWSDPVAVSGLREHLAELDVFQRDESWTITGVAPEFADLLEFAPTRRGLPVVARVVS